MELAATKPQHPILRLMNNDVLTEILQFLPIKPLFRFKLVSKSWNSIISDPSFSRHYRSRRGPPAITGFFCRADKAPPNSPIISTLTYLPLHPSSPSKSFDAKIWVSAASSPSGLVLLFPPEEERLEFYVWCPLTNKAVSPLLHVREDLDFHGDHSINGVGFVADDIGSYQIVLISKIVRQSEIKQMTMFVIDDGLPAAIGDDVDDEQTKGRIHEEDTLYVSTFSSSTTKWAMLAAHKLAIPIRFDTRSVFGVLGADDRVLYWLDHGGCIVSYDNIKEQVEIAELPDGFGGTGELDCPCSIQSGFSGLISLCKRVGPEIKVWVLSRDKRWYLEHKVRFEGLSYNGFSQILYLCKDLQAVYVRVRERVFQCYLKDRSIEFFSDVDDAEERGVALVPYRLPIWPQLQLI